MDFARELWCEIQDDHVLDGAAVLAFFFVLAIFPAAIFVLSLISSFPIPHLHQALLDLLRQTLPAQSADLFNETVQRVGSGGKGGVVLGGLLFALWSGSTGVYALMEQLTTIRDQTESRPFWKVRGIAIALMLFFVALAIISLSSVIFAGVVQTWVASLIGWSHALRVFFATLRWIILAAATFLGIAVAYWLGPAEKGRFQYLSPGSVVAAILIALGSVGFRLYVARFGNYNATYGNVAAIIILMLWMYLAGIALLVGCEINTILYRHKSKSSTATTADAGDRLIREP
jgi:membrane protein